MNSLGQTEQPNNIDDYVSALALQAMAPAALEVSLAAAEQEEDQRAEADRIWRQRMERADYAADRARRQYRLAEPEKLSRRSET